MKTPGRKQYTPEEAEAEAFSCIDNARKVSAKRLNLSGLQLSRVPETIRELPQLTHLVLSDNALTLLPAWLCELIDLEELDVSSNRLASTNDVLGGFDNLVVFKAYNNVLEDFPYQIKNAKFLKVLKLDNNRLSRVPDWVADLESLVELSLSGNLIVALPSGPWGLPSLERLILFSNGLSLIPNSIGSLKSLRVLSLSGNPIHSIPVELGRLSMLSSLCMAGMSITEFPVGLRNLKALHYLAIGSNNIKILPSWIGELVGLRGLDVSGHQVMYDWLENSQSWTSSPKPRYSGLSEIPDSLLRMHDLQALYLHGNSRLGIPEEVLGDDLDASIRHPGIRKREEGNYAQRIISYLLRNRRGNRPLNEAKLILVGRGGVGKTSIVRRLISNCFNSDEIETAGITIQPWEVKMPDLDVVRLHVWDFGGQRILHGTHQFFLTERTVYLVVLSGREDGATQDAEYWLQLISSFGGNSKVIVALNKSEDHPFDVNRGLLIEKYPFIADFVRVDCRTGFGLMQLREMIVSQVDLMEHRKATFPSDWFLIKERLASMSENYITWDDYQEICRSLGELDAASQRELAGFLHILGIALNYSDDPRLNDTRILKPTWVTEGIYSVLRAGQMSNSGGVLRMSDLVQILDHRLYPIGKHGFLIRLMEKFKLCFRISGGDERYLVPELLGENQPNIKDLLGSSGLGFRYQYRILPESLMPRFIVQTHMHSSLRPEWRWRTGVVLSRDGCFGVIRADVRERRVDVHVTGVEKQRRGLLAIIREKFDEQHSELKGLSVDERVPVPDVEGVTVSYLDLIKRESRGELHFYPENLEVKVSVSALLDGVEEVEDRLTRGMRRIIKSKLTNVSSESKKNIFVSYSHSDDKYLSEFLQHLKPYQRSYSITQWSDKKINTGTDWRDAIGAAIASSSLAVLLVSPAFLASDFIIDHELNPVLKKAAEAGMQIVWVPVRASAYKESPLERLQSVVPPSEVFWAQPNRARQGLGINLC